MAEKVYRVISRLTVATATFLMTLGILLRFSLIGVLFFILGFPGIIIAILFEQKANTLKWDKWYEKNRQVIIEYRRKHGRIRFPESHH